MRLTIHSRFGLISTRAGSFAIAFSGDEDRSVSFQRGRSLWQVTLTKKFGGRPEKKIELIID